MFVILTYDVNEKRVNRVRKILRKYLIWTQNSVFEGEITLGALTKCVEELRKTMDKREDSLYVYRVKNSNNIKKEVVGIDRNVMDIFM